MFRDKGNLVIAAAEQTESTPPPAEKRSGDEEEDLAAFDDDADGNDYSSILSMQLVFSSERVQIMSLL